jgi:hypothetical protein
MNIGRPVARGRIAGPHEAVAGGGPAEDAHDTLVAAAAR